MWSINLTLDVSSFKNGRSCGVVSSGSLVRLYSGIGGANSSRRRNVRFRIHSQPDDALRKRFICSVDNEGLESSKTMNSIILVLLKSLPRQWMRPRWKLFKGSPRSFEQRKGCTMYDSLRSATDAVRLTIWLQFAV